MRLLNRHYSDEDAGGVADEEPDDDRAGGPEPDDDHGSGDQPERQEDGSFVYPDGYTITADGRHIDAEGNEVPGEDDRESEERPARQPEARQQPDQRQPMVYTRQNAFSAEELAELAELDLSNPGEAQYRRSERFRAIENYAEDRFDATVDELEEQAPALVELFSRQLSKARRQITPEQKQQPRAAHQIAGMMLGDEVLRLGIADEVAELIRDARRGKAGGRTAPKSERTRDYDLPPRDQGGRFAEQPVRRRTLKPNERMPSFTPQRRDGGRNDRGRDPIAETARKSVPWSDKAMKELRGND